MKSLRNVMTGSKPMSYYKCEEQKNFMIFHGSRMKPVSVQISIRNENITQTNSINFLGIIVDNKLNYWHEHISILKIKYHGLS